MCFRNQWPSGAFPAGHRGERRAMDNSALTFAVGDVHGCFPKLTDLMQCCVDYAGSRPHQFVMLGDYVDRGPDSRAVVKHLRWLGEQDPNRIVCLKGNHEELLLSAVENPSDFPLWIRNGGDATLESYGVDTPAGLPVDD